MSQAKYDPKKMTIIEIDPAKFYIIDIDSEKTKPWQVDDLKAELQKAGIRAGFITAGPGGKTLKVREATEQEVANASTEA